jgi:hypothetical protein
VRQNLLFYPEGGSEFPQHLVFNYRTKQRHFQDDRNVQITDVSYIFKSYFGELRKSVYRIYIHISATYIVNLRLKLHEEILDMQSSVLLSLSSVMYCYYEVGGGDFLRLLWRICCNRN